MKARRACDVKAPPIVWERADPEALRRFNPATKDCTMNCGPHRDDPRSAAERKFLCNECLTANKETPALRNNAWN